jgi:hypothetical protein
MRAPPPRPTSSSSQAAASAAAEQVPGGHQQRREPHVSEQPACQQQPGNRSCSGVCRCQAGKQQQDLTSTAPGPLRSLQDALQSPVAQGPPQQACAVQRVRHPLLAQQAPWQDRGECVTSVSAVGGADTTHSTPAKPAGVQPACVSAALLLPYTAAECVLVRLCCFATCTAPEEAQQQWAICQGGSRRQQCRRGVCGHVHSRHHRHAWGLKEAQDQEGRLGV